LKWLRDAATTVIAHRMVRVEEARLACNDDLKAARKNLKFPIGRTWVYGVEFEDMELQQEWYEVEGDERDEDDEDDEEYELMDDDEPLNDLDLGKKLDLRTAMAWYEQGKLNEVQLLALLKEMNGNDQGKTAPVVDADQPEEVKLPDDLQRALDICKEKGIKGPRALHRAMGGSYYEAQKLYAELVERGLVEAD
jgi:hypothetical protein